MRERKELLGHGLEFAGLIIVLAAVLWQSTFSDWWKDQLNEWQYGIQEEVNLSLLYSVAKLASLETAEDPVQRRELARQIHEGSIKTVTKAIKERDERREQMKTGQAALFLRINSWLAIAGACVFALGKWFTLVAARGRVAKIAKNEE